MLRRWCESRFHGHELEVHRVHRRRRQLLLELRASRSFSSIGVLSSGRIARQRGRCARRAHDLIGRRAPFEKQALGRLLDRLAVQRALAPFVTPAQSVVVQCELGVCVLALIDQIASPTRVSFIEWLVVCVEVHVAMDHEQRLQVFQDRRQESLPGISSVAVRDDLRCVALGGAAHVRRDQRGHGVLDPSGQHNGFAFHAIALRWVVINLHPSGKDAATQDMSRKE
jgi:hypothetical protein